jgi:hypothetical protein
MAVKRGTCIIGTFQCVTTTANAAVMFYFNLKAITRWVAMEGREHVAYRLKICSWVGKVLGDYLYDC